MTPGGVTRARQIKRAGIIGGRGFVGSAFVRALESCGINPLIIGREDYDALVGSRFDLLINANGNSSKVVAARQPMDDFDESVRSVRRSVLDLRADLYVYLSSCDVYSDCSSPQTTREDMANAAGQSAYGFHKWLAEACVRHAPDRSLIFRLGGMVGPGLRKNPVYDIVHGGLVWLDPGSRLQFMDTDSVAATVLEIVDLGLSNRVFNLCGLGTVKVADAIEWSGQPVEVAPGSPTVTYDVSTDAIRAFVRLPESEDAVRDYMRLHPAPPAHPPDVP